MAGNRPARERFEFSLDARQVAAVILGSLGALALAFFLGHALGKRVAERPAPAAPVAAAPAKPADPLAALDQAPRPDGGETDTRLSYHEALTASRPPPEHLPPAPKQQPIPAPVPDAKVPPAKPAAAPAASGAPAPSGPAVAAVPTSAPAGAPAPAEPKAAPQAKASAPPAKPAPQAAKAAPAPAKPTTAPAKSAGKGAFVVQVGSTQDRFEAERIAARFASRGPRVTAADVPGKGRWYRVRLGSFDTREAADRYLRDLERTTGAKGFVTTAN